MLAHYYTPSYRNIYILLFLKWFQMVSTVTMFLALLHTFCLSGSHNSVPYFGKINIDPLSAGIALI